MSVDILVNNTSAGVSVAVPNYAGEALLEMMVLNMFSVTAICKYFVPQMKARKTGRMLNIASLAGYQPVPNIAASAASAASESYGLNFSDAIAMALEDYATAMGCHYLVTPRGTRIRIFLIAQTSVETANFTLIKRAFHQEVLRRTRYKKCFAASFLQFTASRIMSSHF